MDIKEIAGKHLGRTMTGELMTPYVAPLVHDSSLLVPIPREFGREKANINNSQMYGGDVWHAYEFSYLNEIGQPVTGILKMYFSLRCKNMIESKSLKLYLNSFDFEKIGKYSLTRGIRDDLSKVADGLVHVEFFPSNEIVFSNFNSFARPFIENSIDNLEIENISFDESDEYLKTRLWNYGNNIRYFHTANLRSACEITNQKDTGHCYIAMRGEAVFRIDELARFIFSMRNAQHFHENVTEIIFDKLMKFYEPEDLFVLNVYNRRGGLDIHPMRYTNNFYNEIFECGDYMSVDVLGKLSGQV